MLGELGKEQKFEVTYVEVEEKNDEDQIQCLVQLSTLPVAVSYSCRRFTVFIFFYYLRCVTELAMTPKLPTMMQPEMLSTILK